MSGDFLFTSESVSCGHPDKLADQVSDAVLDAILSEDCKARVACETLVNTGVVFIAGEITSSANIPVPEIARQVIRAAGYDRAALGFDAETCAVLVSLDKQSPDIATGVDNAGAGDQGLIFGYACRETPSLMPAPIYYAHLLMQQQAKMRSSKALPWLRPDAKSQVSVRYREDKPTAITAVVLSTQHDPEITLEQIKEAVMEHIIKPVLPSEWITRETVFHINPTGRFVIGGPMGDCGLTGRKIIVDTYGGMARHGGGAFSGKDPSKVDRSAAYAARYVAKNIVAAGLADRCEIQIAYAIGVAKPVAIHVETFDTGVCDESQLIELIEKHFDLTPTGIIQTLDLCRPIYRQTAVYGHFGRDDLDLPWERTDKALHLRDDIASKYPQLREKAMSV